MADVEVRDPGLALVRARVGQQVQRQVPVLVPRPRGLPARDAAQQQPQHPQILLLRRPPAERVEASPAARGLRPDGERVQPY